MRPTGGHETTRGGRQEARGRHGRDGAGGGEQAVGTDGDTAGVPQQLPHGCQGGDEVQAHFRSL